MDDLPDGLDQRSDTGIQHDRGNDHGAQVFDPPVSQGVLPVRRPSRQFRADDRDDRRERVGQIVHGVQHHGDGVRDQAGRHLEGRKKHICQNARYTGPDNDPFPVFCRHFHGDPSIFFRIPRVYPFISVLFCLSSSASPPLQRLPRQAPLFLPVFRSSAPRTVRRPQAVFPPVFPCCPRCSSGA